MFRLSFPFVFVKSILVFSGIRVLARVLALAPAIPARPSGAGWRLESTADLAHGPWVAWEKSVADGTLELEPQGEHGFSRLVRP